MESQKHITRFPQGHVLLKIINFYEDFMKDISFDELCELRDELRSNHQLIKGQ